DAGVLYVRRRDYPAVGAILEKIYPEVEGVLDKGMPALTKRLAPGLGLAEDSGNGESFGLHRCMLLAEGLLLAHEAGLHSADEKLQVVLEHLTQGGVGVERPYLRPGSSDDYS